jgi:hypothetical protein
LKVSSQYLNIVTTQGDAYRSGDSGTQGEQYWHAEICSEVADRHDNDSRAPTACL